MKGKEWKRKRKQVLDRDEYQCKQVENEVRCSSITDLTVDHILPRSQGGTNDLSNLQTLCLEHHRIKSRWEQEYYKQVGDTDNGCLAFDGT